MAQPMATASDSLEARVARLEKLVAEQTARQARIDWTQGLITSTLTRLTKFLKEKLK